MQLRVLESDDAPQTAFFGGHCCVYATLPVDVRSDREIAAQVQAELELDGFQFDDRRGIDATFWKWRFA